MKQNGPSKRKNKRRYTKPAMLQAADQVKLVTSVLPQENEPAIGSMESLPDEILLKIFHHVLATEKSHPLARFFILPAIYFIQEEALCRVNKRWNNLITDHTLTVTKSIPEIIKTCQQNPQLALYVLANDFIFSHLTFTEIKEITSCYPEMAQYAPLLKNKPFFSPQKALHDKPLLNQADSHLLLSLKSLGTHYVELALNDNIVLDKLTATSLAELGNSRVAIAYKILHDKKLRTKLLADPFPGAQLVILSQKNLVIAKAILQDSELRALLEGKHLASLGVNHPALIDVILTDQSLKNKLGSNDLLRLCTTDVKIAERIIQESDLAAKIFDNDAILGNELFDIAVDSPLLVDRIWREITLRSKLSSHQLIKLGANYPVFAQVILQEETLKKQMGINVKNLLGLAAYYPSITKIIITDPSFSAILTSARNHPLWESLAIVQRIHTQAKEYCTSIKLKELLMAILQVNVVDKEKEKMTDTSFTPSYAHVKKGEYSQNFYLESPVANSCKKVIFGR